MSDITLEGYLLSQKRGNVRFVTSSLCLEFGEDDVVAVEEAPLSPGVKVGIGVPVVLTLKVGSTLLDAYSAKPFEGLLRTGRQPFAISARERDAKVAESVRYRALETEFLKKHGLI